jgi:hypothetical protein
MKTVSSFYSKVFFYVLVVILVVFGSNRSYGYEWSKTFGGSLDDVGA